MLFGWKSGDDFIELLQDLDEAKYAAMKNVRITCFTEEKLNPVMWSHYAQNFSGICLRFDLTQDKNLHDAVQPVEYKDDLVEITSVDDFDKCFFTKLKPWESEREWRIISDKAKFTFNKDALVEVVLGHKVQESFDGWFSYFMENAYYYNAKIRRLKIKNNRLIKADRYGDPIPEDEDAEIALHKQFKLDLEF